MRGNRTLIFVAVILLLIALAGVFLWTQGGLGGLMGGGEVAEEATPTPEVAQVEIVVAAQNIGMGQPIKVEDNAAVMQPWPEDALPLDYYEDLDQVDGKFARIDIPRGMPILPKMVGEPGGKLSVSGSPAALFGDAGRRAYAVLFDAQGSVAWAIRPGDHVDVLASFNLMPVDEEFQTQLPNEFTPLEPVGGVVGEDGQIQGGLQPGTRYPYGRFESLPGGQDAFIVPSAGKLPTYLVVQMTVQDAIVWNVGIWEQEGEEGAPAGAAAQAPAAEEGGGGVLGQGQQTPQRPVPPATEQPPENEYVTLLVTPQDALILKYLAEMGADLDLALRSTGDEAPVITEPVWLRYVLDRYQLPETPPALPVRLEKGELLPTPTPPAPPTPVEE
ncbi:MAG: Flp pilus assembly protein CpaB [Anaerolineae bacterium]